MHTDNGETVSGWMTHNKDLPHESLTASTTADVCIVGAGLAGLSVAYFLAKAGKSVVVLDDGEIGGGETSRTTAQLVNALDAHYTDIVRLHGEEQGKLAAESHSQAIDAVEKIVKSEGIDCDFARLDGYLMLGTGEPQQVLDEELQAAHRCGLTKVEMLDRAPLSFCDTGKCLRFPHQAQFDPLKYLAGLAHAIEKMGGRIFTHTHVAHGHGGTHAQVRTSSGKTVKASAIVIATNTPVNDRFVIHTKQAPYRSYVIGARIPKGSVPRMLLWDTPVGHSNAFHYVRIVEGWGHDADLLMVGGEDHKTGQADDAGKRYARLEKWAEKHFPMIDKVVMRWSGQVMDSVDGLAFIGRNPLDHHNVFIATGDSGNGMTHATIAGMLLSELICGRDHPWAHLYAPNRKPFKAAKKFVEENTNLAMQYTAYVTPGEVSSADEVAPDSGAIIRKGPMKIALYRDDKGTIHKFSASCPHLGGIVHWNSLEKTWDCPCHGARYTKEGKVVNGPSNKDLKRVK